MVTAALSAAAPFSKGNIRSGVREDRANRWVLIPFVVIGLLVGYLPALFDRLGWLTFGGEGLRWLGVAIYAVGGALRVAPVFKLGELIQRPCRAAGRPSAGDRRSLSVHPKPEPISGSSS